jgi:serine/threonine protein kinase
VDSRLLLPVNTVLDGSYRIMRVVGSGGFGITYEAEDINLGTMIAIKEYYPFDFGDRDRTMSVRPKSDRHKQTFEWGRSNFLQEARTLARFEHPSIVRVTRVFEANSTAYMVMRFEQGQSFEEWLRALGRPPTQDELDGIIAPLLDALQMMHAANFLHRDIAPDNIIIRTDGTPVLLDFGAARRAVAEMSRSLTGIVKAGYSPHEQYTSDGRLQGPWSDLYAFGGTLYRAVTGKAPEEATLRFDEDRMAPAVQAAKGKYRRDFLGAIDTCLKVRHSERPRTVAQLRPMLLGARSQPKGTERLIEPTYKIPSERVAPSAGISALRQVGRRWPAIAAAIAVVAGAYGGFEYRRWSASEGAGSGGLAAVDAEAKKKAAAEAAARQAALDAERLKKEKEEAEARQQQAALEAEQRRKDKEAADARQRQIEIEEAKRRKDLADAAEAEAKRKEQQRIAAVEEEKRRVAAEEARRKEQADAEARRKAEAAAEAKRKEDLRIAALEDEKRRVAAEEARRKEQGDAETRRKAEAAAEAERKEDLRIAALEDEKRRKEQADAEARRKAEAAAEAKRKEQADAEEKRRIAALEQERRKEQAAADSKLKEERRIAALEETRRADEKRKEDERVRLAALPDDDARAEFVRKIQQVLKRSRCYDGAVTGLSTDAQDGLDKFVDKAHQRGKSKPVRIELAKATVGDFETWLKDADALKEGLCAPVAKPAEKPAVKAVERPSAPKPRPPQYSAPRPSYGGGGGGGGGGGAPIQGIR